MIGDQQEQHQHHVIDKEEEIAAAAPPPTTTTAAIEVDQKKLDIQRTFWDIVNDSDDSEREEDGDDNEEEEGYNEKTPIPTDSRPKKKLPPRKNLHEVERWDRNVLAELEEWEDEHEEYDHHVPPHDDNATNIQRRKNLPFVFNVRGKKITNKSNLDPNLAGDDDAEVEEGNMGSFVNDGRDDDNGNIENSEEGRGLLSATTERKVFGIIEKWATAITIGLLLVIVAVFSIDAILEVHNEEELQEIMNSETTLSMTPSIAPMIQPTIPTLPPTTDVSVTYSPTSIHPDTSEQMPSTATTSLPSVSTNTVTGNPTTTPSQDVVTTGIPSTTPPTAGGGAIPNADNPATHQLIRETVVEILSMYFPNNDELLPSTSIQEDALNWLVDDILLRNDYELKQNMSFNNGTYYPLLERFVLAILYFESNRRDDDDNTIWNQNQYWLSSNKSVCEWYGLTCRNNNNNDSTSSSSGVDKIELIQNDLQGTIPSELATLTKLTKLSLRESLCFRCCFCGY